MTKEKRPDIYDWLHFADAHGWHRRCPKCGDEDVKYATHSKEIVFCELSVRCNACRHEDSGDNSGADVERMICEWHERGGE